MIECSEVMTLAESTENLARYSGILAEPISIQQLELFIAQGLRTVNVETTDRKHSSLNPMLGGVVYVTSVIVQHEGGKPKEIDIGRNQES